MENKSFDDTLIKILEKEVLIERWKKKFKISGKVIRKRITKKGSFLFTLKTRKSEYDVVVPQYKKEEFELAKNINEEDIIKIIGERQIGGVIFCDRIKKLDGHGFNERQIKLSC